MFIYYNIVLYLSLTTNRMHSGYVLKYQQSQLLLSKSVFSIKSFSVFCSLQKHQAETYDIHQ